MANTDETNVQTEPQKEQTPMKEMTVEATVESIDEVTDFINEELEANECSMRIQTQIAVAVDEVMANIAMYAYRGRDVGPATVRVGMQDDPRAAVIVFIDEGMPYNPLTAKEPDITLGIEDRPIGGLGIFLVRKTMDEVDYERDGDKNVLTVKKYL